MSSPIAVLDVYLKAFELLKVTHQEAKALMGLAKKDQIDMRSSESCVFHHLGKVRGKECYDTLMDEALPGGFRYPLLFNAESLFSDIWYDDPDAAKNELKRILSFWLRGERSKLPQEPSSKGGS